MTTLLISIPNIISEQTSSKLKIYSLMDYLKGYTAL
jgi:hypothetical protein